MAKAYLIGGTPRTGKTTLTLRAVAEHTMLAVSTDAIRYTLRRVINANDQPGLFNLGNIASNDPRQRHDLLTNPEKFIVMQNAESAIVWKSVKDFINSNILDGYDILVEGTAILPEYVRQLDCGYSAVFLGNQSDEHVATILRSARANPNDWMHSLEDETIIAFAGFNQAFSRYVERSARKNSCQYVEVHDDHFEDDISIALKLLLG